MFYCGSFKFDWYSKLDIGFVIFTAIALVIIYFLPLGKHSSVSLILLCGISCVGVGVVGWYLMGRDIYELVTLKKTAGFGRAYVIGLGIILAGTVIFLINSIRLLTKRILRGSNSSFDKKVGIKNKR